MLSSDRFRLRDIFTKLRGHGVRIFSRAEGFIDESHVELTLPNRVTDGWQLISHVFAELHRLDHEDEVMRGKRRQQMELVREVVERLTRGQTTAQVADYLNTRDRHVASK
jgi:hypothetical protein